MISYCENRLTFETKRRRGTGEEYEHPTIVQEGYDIIVGGQEVLPGTTCCGGEITVEIYAGTQPYSDGEPCLEINYRCSLCAGTMYDYLPNNPDDLSSYVQACLRNKGEDFLRNHLKDLIKSKAEMSEVLRKQAEERAKRQGNPKRPLGRLVGQEK